MVWYVSSVVAFPKSEPAISYTMRQIPVSRIRVFAFQPRKWFDAEEITARAESMKALGQQDPVTVEPVYGDPDYDYELINGESRLRSACEANITMLWASVRSVPFASPVEKHLASLVANFNRSDHTAMEVSDALHIQITQGGKTQAQIARALGKSYVWVSHHLSLQKLHPDLQAMMHPSRPKKERMATVTAFELARLPRERQLEILKKARSVKGNTSLLRQTVRELKKDTVHEAALMHWTPEREARRQVLNTPNPEHLAILSAGIKEFRKLLNYTYRR